MYFSEKKNWKKKIEKKSLIGNPKFLVPTTTLMYILRQEILQAQFLSDFQKLGVKIFGKKNNNR